MVSTAPIGMRVKTDSKNVPTRVPLQKGGEYTAKTAERKESRRRIYFNLTLRFTRVTSLS